MRVLDADIEEIVRAVWSTVFDLGLQSDGDAHLGSGPTVTACVQIEGGWDGAVLLQCPQPLAMTLTAAMFQSTEPPPFEDVRDALGELANMVAGNIKSLLPEHCHISLPAVVLGSDQHFSVVGTETITAVSFLCDRQPLLITLLRQARPRRDSQP